MNQALYRLYTERRPNLGTIAARHVPGFTVIEAYGYWQGSTEISAIIEIVGDDSADTRGRVYDLAEDIRATNEQTAVLVTEQPVVSTLVTS